MDRAAASRQKSCNACVRGKRKCDKRTPKCTRCTAKGLNCVYQRTPASSHNNSISGSGSGSCGNLNRLVAASPAPAGDSPVGTASVIDAVDFDMDFGLEGLGTGTGSTPSSGLQTDVALQLDSHLDFSILDLMSGDSAPGTELWMQDLAGKMDIPPVPSPPVRQPMRDLALLGDSSDCSMALNPLDVHNPRTRIGFVLDYIATMHQEFARTRALPFIHHRLYGSNLPRTILNAFTASAAYTNRTPQTKSWVIKLVSDMAREIHRDGERAVTPLEKIARVQALVILDTIRLFDGDVGLRAAAEREIGQMVVWGESLNEVLEKLKEDVGEPGPVPREKPPKSWDGWVMLESVRRTSLMAFSFICISTILKSLEPPCDILNAMHSFTASRHLWDAATSVEFYRAWYEKPQYCVTNMEFKDFWMYGRAEDADDFTRLMLTAQVGPDAMDHFMTGVLGSPS